MRSLQYHPPRRAGERRRAHPRRVVPRAPRVALVPAHVVPGAEVGVVVLAPGLEEVRVVRDQHGGHARPAQPRRHGLLPHLDRPPRPPQEVERPAEDVVARRHAREGAGHVRGEAHGPLAGEAVQVRGVELRAAVGAQHVPVQAVEQEHDGVARRPRRRRVGETSPGAGSLSGPADSARSACIGGHATTTNVAPAQAKPRPSGRVQVKADAWSP